MNAEGRSYASYRRALLALAQELDLTTLCYSPYQDHKNLQTILIYNQALLTSDQACLHISGTHGIEGFAGAEIQIAILKKIGNVIQKSKVGCLFIFALNPFGFQFLRRTSIENIDLNRNTGDGLPTSAPNWRQPWLLPLLRSHSVPEQLQGLIQGLTLGALKGFPNMIRAFAEGQNLEPQGLFYTGTRMALEIKALLDQLRPLIQNKQSLRILDVHTGLGKLYEEMLILGSGDIGELQTLFEHPLEIPGAKPNSYRGVGLLSDRFAKEFPESSLQFVVQEFGVKSSLQSFLALAIENRYHWRHFKRCPEKRYLTHPTKEFFFKTYFSTNPIWLDWLTETGTKRFCQLLREK